MFWHIKHYIYTKIILIKLLQLCFHYQICMQDDIYVYGHS